MQRQFFCAFMILLLLSPSMNSFASDQSEDTINNSQQLKTEVQKLRKKVETLEVEKATEYLKFEKAYADKLLELSEGNFKAPSAFLNWLTAIVMLFIAFSGIIAFLIRHLLIQKLEEKEKSSLNKIEEKAKDLEDELQKKLNLLNESVEQAKKYFTESLSQENKKIERNQARLYTVASEYYCDKSIKCWAEKNIENAIEYGELAIFFGEKAVKYFGEDHYQIIFNLGIYKSNLAYYYADRNRVDKKETAREYANVGLEEGIKSWNKGSTQGLDLIDNFLFVWMKFGPTTEEEVLSWCKTFDIYSSDLEREGVISLEDKADYQVFHSEICSKR